MKEMRTIRDYYTDIKRTSAMSGPYRRHGIPLTDKIVAGIGIAFAVFALWYAAGAP